MASSGMDGWVDGWMDGWMNERVIHPHRVIHSSNFLHLKFIVLFILCRSLFSSFSFPSFLYYFLSRPPLFSPKLHILVSFAILPPLLPPPLLSPPLPFLPRPPPLPLYPPLPLPPLRSPPLSPPPPPSSSSLLFPPL